MLYKIIISLGSLFGVLGALMAYLITYGEYVHHYPDKMEPRKMALRAGFYTLLFFIILSVFLAFVLTKMNL